MIHVLPECEGPRKYYVTLFGESNVYSVNTITFWARPAAFVFHLVLNSAMITEIHVVRRYTRQKTSQLQLGFKNRSEVCKSDILFAHDLFATSRGHKRSSRRVKHGQIVTGRQNGRFAII
jgi:hypothetical protein